MGIAEQKTAFNSRAKASMREFLRSKTWEEKVESIERMNQVHRTMRQIRLICDLSTEEYAELKDFLNNDSKREHVDSRWIVLESAAEQGAVQKIQDLCLWLATPGRAGVGNAKAHLNNLLTTWVARRNERMKASIRAGSEKSLTLNTDVDCWSIRADN